MKKIEPVAWVKTCPDDLIGEVIKSVTQNPNNSRWQPLYTREEFESALEEMKRECMFAAKEWAMMHVEVDHAPHGVDDEISKYVSVYEVLENILGE